MLKPATEAGWQDLEARVICPRCRRNGREADFLIIGVTADPPVDAFLGHYRCLTCRWDFVDGLSCPPEERELLQVIAVWRERHRPSRRLHHLYLRAVYGLHRGFRLDPLNRIDAALLRERVLAGGEPGFMAVTGPSGNTVQIALSLTVPEVPGADAALKLAYWSFQEERLTGWIDPAVPTEEDEAYVCALFLTPEERRVAERCPEDDEWTVLYMVHLYEQLRPIRPE